MLVGQSYGGLVIRGFFARYPSEVTGMVMVDAVHEDQRVVYGGQPHRIRDSARGRQVPAPQVRLDAEMIKLAHDRPALPETALEAPLDRLPMSAQLVWRWANTKPLLGLAQEAELDWSPEELERMHSARLSNRASLGDLPLVVLARTHGGYADGMSISAADLERERRDLQADLARLSHKGKLIFAAHSGHNIHLEDPDLVVSAIREVVGSAQEPRFVYPVPSAGAFTKIEARYKTSSAASLGLDLFRPTTVSPGQTFPVLIVFNGFGGSFLRTSSQAEGWAKAATAHGFAGVTEETVAGHTAEDFDSLVAYLRQHAAELRVDPERIAVIAWSGAVSNALPVVEDPERTSIKAAVIYYGAAEVKQIRLDLPVLYVRAGLDQPITNHHVDQVIAAGLAANAPWTVLNYPGGHHGFDVVDDNDASREVIEQTFRFLELAVSAPYQTALRAGLPEASAAGALATGDYDKAAALYAPLAQSRPQDARVLLAYGNALVGAKRYREARGLFDRVKAIGTAGARDLGIPAARACALDNDPDAAIGWLKTIPHQFLPASAQSDPAFASLKARPDFQDLFRSQ